MRPITGKELCKLLEQNGWVLKRVRGSHFIYGKQGYWKIITVPVHGNTVLKPGLASKIAKDAEIQW